MDAAIVGSVFSCRKLAILLHSRLRHVLSVFILNALIAFVVVGGVLRCPPVAQVSRGIKFAALIVEAVSDLVANDGSNAAVVYRVDLICVEKWRLKYARWKIDGISLRVFVGIDRWWCHAPLLAVCGLAKLCH